MFRRADPPARRLAAGLFVLLPVAAAACRPAPDPVSVDARTVRVQNQTAEEWSDVEVWVNHHYRATARTLAPGGLFVAPLTGFVAGFGQRFDPGRQAVQRVRVTAKTPDGTVSMEWAPGAVTRVRRN